MSSDFDPRTPLAAERAYRIMILSALGTVLASKAIAAASDDAALAIAESLAGVNAVELWDGLRFIEHLKPIREQLSA